MGGSLLLIRVRKKRRRDRRKEQKPYTVLLLGYFPCYPESTPKLTKISCGKRTSMVKLHKIKEDEMSVTVMMHNLLRRLGVLHSVNGETAQ